MMGFEIVTTEEARRVMGTPEKATYLVALLEGLPTDTKVRHWTMGDGVYGWVTHRTEKSLVLELSDGRALVEDLDSANSSWTLWKPPVLTKLCSWLHKHPFHGAWTEYFIPEGQVPWEYLATEDMTRELRNKSGWVRCVDNDREAGIYG